MSHSSDTGAPSEERTDHSFGQDLVRPGERRTIWVIVITAIMMVLEIAAGIAFGSMALLADGLHMGSHAAALGVTAFAYVYARKHANDPRFSFGTGKMNALGGFSSAIILALFALLMVFESVNRFLHPQSIAFNDAILVAVVGLVVNIVCAVILSGGGKSHDHGNTSDATPHAHAQGHSHGGEDHNLKSAVVHVITDALTSVLAIGALLAAKYVGLMWMDPMMGVAGAVLVAVWAVRLIGATSGVLLDRQAPESTVERIRESIEHRNGDRVRDLHVWSIGPGIFAAELSITSTNPLSVDEYKATLPADTGIVHAMIEVIANEPQR